MLNDYTRNSRFAIILTGDGDIALVADGWQKMLQALRGHLFDGNEPPSYWTDMISDMHDEENWSHDNYGMFHYGTRVGAGRLNVYRVHD